VLELKDWKTGKYFEDSGQLKFYAFAQSKLMDLSKIKEIKGTLHFVSCNKLYNTLIKPEEITETQKEIENFVKEVRYLSEFPKTNKNCFFCDHRELCKANDNPFVGKVRIKKNEQA
jgi:CRISPR/Cas system-associated exonuclease Cas4 (RecB family)